MVAIVTGSGLGLQSSSLGLGSKGQIGSAQFGQGGEQLYVNAANGNLVIRDRDDLLMGQGIASELYRAYNSQGQFANDHWRPGTARTVDGLTGTLNTAGSTLTRTDWDGSAVVYAYDASRQCYVATTGQGTRDTLRYNAADKTWTWTQGSTRLTERYDSTQGGRITATVDTSGNTTLYAYNVQGLLASVTTASGEVTYLDYQGTQLTQLRTVLKHADGRSSTQTSVRYAYDSLGRLAQVIVDLSPEDNSIADDKVYRTAYTYDGSSARIASITASDGSQVAFSYQLIDGDYRVTRVAETSDVGIVRVTTLAYANGQTTVTDPLGQVTVLNYDGTGRLTQLDAPAVDGVVSSQRFRYDAQGNVTSITDAKGNVVSFTYDTRGNLIQQAQQLADGAKLIVERTYGAHDELLSETTYRDPGGLVGSGMYLPSDPLTTHYVYDSRGLLRFVVTPEGRVTDYRSNAAGQVVSTLAYAGSTYAGTAFGEADLAAWVDTLADKSQAVRTDTTYDFRGNVASVTQYARLRADGNGDPSEVTRTLYVYDPQGRLLQRLTGASENLHAEHYTYDGLGRLLSATQANGAVTLYRYDDAHRQTTVTYANGLVRTTTYNAAGEAISVTESAQGKVLSQTQNQYDALGRLILHVDANDGRTHYLYDAASRLIGEVTPDGALTEYRYDPAGLLGETLRYATPLSAEALASLDAGPSAVSGLIGGGPFKPPAPTFPGTGLSANHGLDTIRPPARANDRRDWRLYDEAGRLRRSVDAAGVVTDYVYDGADRLTSRTVYATPIDTTVLVAAAQDGTLNPLSGHPVADSARDRTTRYAYDKDGRVLGQLDAEGYLTEYRYNAAGQLIETIRYATATPENQRAHGALSAWLPAPGAQDIHTSYHYDARGLLTTEVDGEGYLTTYTYDAYGNVASRTRGQRIDPAQFNAPQQVPISFQAQGTLGSVVDVWVDGIKVGSITLTSSGYATYTLTADHVVPLLHHTIELRSANGATTNVRNAMFGERAVGSDATLGADGVRYTLDALQTLLAWATLPGPLQQTRYSYDADGHLLAVTDVGLDGVVGATTYTYDEQGRVTRETRDGRSVTYRYDAQGRLIGQLGGEGSAALDALGGNASQAAIDAVWQSWGVRYAYDAAGQRISMTDANGNATRYYYDEAGRLAAVINALGEAIAYQSDVFSNVVQTTVYASRVAAGTLAALVGGSLTDAMRTLLDQLRSSDDRITRYDYTARGELSTVTDALGFTTATATNAFGEITGVTQQLDKNGRTSTTTYTYDRLGQQTTQTTDAGGLNLVTQAIYDAFGRVIESIDANGIHRSQRYDRNGQRIVLTDGNGGKTQFTYDAFGHVLSQTDANGATTRYSYSAFDRQVTMTTAEGIVTTTQYDAFGAVTRIRDGNGNVTHYRYDRDGQLTMVIDALGNVTQQAYDKAGQRIETTDARGTQTAYRYDAAGRVLTRTVDPTGLKLTTTYAYSALGEVIRVIDPAGVVTETRYDANGQTVAVIVDPEGLRLTTTFEYDGAGNTVVVTEGAGSNAQKVTQYAYDNAGRLLGTVVDPNGLALTTHYTYDGNGNTVARTDANGAVTRYVYDAANQLALTVDAAGAVTRTAYDAAGNLIARTQYAHRIDLNGLGNAISDADVSARLAASASDRTTRYAYDTDNRLIYTVDALGVVTEQRYDANGNVTRTSVHAAAISVSGDFTRVAIAARLATNLATDRVVDYFYDAGNRLIFKLDSYDNHSGRALTEFRYDEAGNLLRQIGYNGYLSTSPGGLQPTLDQIRAYAGTKAEDWSSHSTQWFYDAAGRQVFRTERGNAEYRVTEWRYDRAGNVSEERRYTPALGSAATLTLAGLQAATRTLSAHATQWRYDSAGRAIDTVDALGTITHHERDAMGRIVSETRAYGTAEAQTTTRSYDASGRLLEETRAAGTAIAATTRYVYDALGQLIQTIDPRGVTLVSGPDSQALRDQRKALGVTDSAGHGKGLDQLTDADIAKLLSYYTTFTDYDAMGNVTQTRSPYGAPDPGGAAYATVTTQYNAFGNAVAVTDARGYTGYFYYDGSDRVIAQVDPNGYLTTTTYDAFGNPTVVSAYQTRLSGPFDPDTPPAVPGGTVAVTRMVYDTLGYLIQATDAQGGVEKWTYDHWGNRLSYTNKLGLLTTWNYNPLGQATSEIALVNGVHVTSKLYAYDALGNLNTTQEMVSAGPPNVWSVTHYAYDALDRLITTTRSLPNGTAVEQREYDANGNLTALTDPNGHRSVYGYDAANRLSYEVNATGAYTQYAYDAAGNRIQTRAYSNAVPLPVTGQPAGSGAVRETQYAYDAANRLIQTYQPNVNTFRADTSANSNADFKPSTGITRTWAYDANGQLVIATDGNGHISRTWYDALGQVLLTVDADGYGIAFTRDANGNVLNETRFAQVYPGDPATLSDAAAAIASWPRSVDDRTTDYTYDLNGRVLSETRRQVVYGVVDAYGRLSQQTGDAVTHYAYDNAGNLLKRTDANGAEYVFEYDLIGRLTAMVAPRFTDYAGRTVQTRTEYAYNMRGDVIRETIKGANGAADQISLYTYDIAGRLTAKTNALGVTTLMAYDAVGNLVQMRYTRTDSAGVAHGDVITMQYDAANQEVWRQSSEDGVAGVARRTQYNVFGEVTARGTGDTAWQEISDYDNAGRLIRSNAGDGITRIYLYDAEGNATMAYESQTLDLRSIAIFNANGAVDLGSALFTDPDTVRYVSWTLTTYDGRNQVTDVIQPTMAIDGQYLGLAPRPVHGGAPGQIGVEVGGPIGGVAQWPPISGADVLGVMPGSQALGSANFNAVGVGYVGAVDRYVTYQVTLPDLSSIYGKYDLIVSPAYGTGTGEMYVYDPGAGTFTVDVPTGITRWDPEQQQWIPSIALLVEVVASDHSRSPLATMYFPLDRSRLSDPSYYSQISGTVPLEIPASPKLKLSPTDSSQLSGGALSAQIYVRPWGSNGQYTALPINVDPSRSSVDLSSLNGSYEVVYLAERADGSLARAEQYQLVTDGTHVSLNGPWQTGESAFNTFGGGTFLIADNALIGVNMTTLSGQRAAWASFAYRRPGSNDAWTWISNDQGIGFNGSRMGFDGIPDGTWEINLWMFDGDNNPLQMLAGTLVTGEEPSITLDYPHPAGNTLTFSNIPLGADTIHLVLTNQVDGTPWDFGDFAITTPGRFVFDMPDWMMNQVAAWGGQVNFTVEATFTDDNEVPSAVYTANGVIQAGNRRQPSGPIVVDGHLYTLDFDPRDDNDNPFDAGQYLLLRYWPEDADIVANPGVIQNVLIRRAADGRYHWDSLGLDPTQSYAYYYDVFDSLEAAQNPGSELELTRNEGYFTPAHEASGTEQQWVIDNVHHDTLTIHRHQAYNAFGEVASETDGRGNTVELYYNTLGNLVLKRDPNVQITYANGYQAWLQPQTQYSYDRTGRLVGQIDPNGNLTTQIWNDGTGTVAQEFRADGGTTVYQVDVFGNQRVKIDALDVYSINAASGRRTDYTYDAGNRLIKIERPAVNGQRAVDTYTYDELDRRLSHTNSVTGRDTVDYDLEGNVRQIVSAAGRVTTYTNVWDQSLYNGQGGWVQTTRLPYNPGDNAYGQSVLVDLSTAFGQTTQHTDIAGRVTDYLYYNNGLLKQQGAAHYSYYNNGLLREMLDTENATRGYYEYDNNGNLTFEGFTGKSGNWAFQQSVATYDALNRLVKVSDPRYTIDYEYDAVGNRIHLRSEYNDAFGQATQVQDYWYAYDSMNRFTTTMGQLKDGRRGDSASDTSAYVYQGTGGDGVSLGYNTFGERMVATYASDGHRETYDYDAQGYLTTTTLTDRNGGLMGIAVRENDLAGRVTHYLEYNANRFVTQEVWHTWDNDSLLLGDKVIAWDASKDDGQGRYTITTTDTYRLADGTVRQTHAYLDENTGDASKNTTIDTYYDYVWFDSAKQSTIRVQASNQDAPGWAPGLSAFEYDSFGRLKAAYDVDGGRGFAYQTDGEGRILQRDELLGTYNEQTGRIDNATSNRWHAYYYLDDRQIGNVGNDGIERIDYAQELAQRAQNNSNKDQDHKRFRPVAGADFDGNYLPINSLYPTAAPGSYIVHAGDTLTSIAMALWGDSSLWWLLADANGLSLNEPLIPNTVLTVPNKVTNLHNNSSTFKPYDAGKAIGNTNPTIPDAPPPPQPKGGKGCGGVLQIVAIAVAVVATIYTAGAAAGLLGVTTGAAGAGTFATGLAVLGGTAVGSTAAIVGAAVVGGAVGSIASQGVLIAGGAQQDFNWKGVALSGIGAGVTAGAGAVANGGGVVANALNNSSGLVRATSIGATNSAVTNAIGSVTGLQSFSWKNVAASAVSAGVGYAANRFIGQAQYGTAGWNTLTKDSSLAGQVFAADPWSSAARNVSTAFLAGASSAAVRGNFSQSLVGITQDVIGSTVGNMVAEQMAARTPSTAAGNAYDTLRAEGASRDVALNIVTHPGMADVFAATDMRNAVAQASGYANFEALSPEQQINVLTGTVTVHYPPSQTTGYDTLEPESASPTQSDSLAMRYGKAISHTIVDAQHALGDLIDVIGEDNVKWGLRGVQLALGGIPRTAVSLAAEASGITTWGMDLIQQHVRDPLSQSIGAHIFGASNQNELLAVMPASNLSADFVVGLGGSSVGVLASSGIAMAVRAAKGGSIASAEAQSALNTVRVSARQSELDVGASLGSSAKPQVSYINGKEVPYGTKGSVRPDFVSTNGAASFEVKNYNVATNQSGLIKNVSQQAIQRQANLPPGMKQQVVIDIRGQAVTAAQERVIVQGIVQKSNGIIDPNYIRFMREN